MSDELIALPECQKCHTVHRTSTGSAACLAHNARTLKPCRAHPVPGGTVCVTHGGRTQVTGRLVRDFRQQQELQYATNMLGLVDFDITPEEALLQEVRETAANVAFLRARVQALVGEKDLDDPSHPLVWGTIKETSISASATPGSDTEEGAAINGWYLLYQQEREHLFKVSQAAVRAGIAERRVRLAEMGADVIVGRIRQILNALDLTPQQLLAADSVVPVQIAALAQDLEGQAAR